MSQSTPLNMIRRNGNAPDNNQNMQSNDVRNTGNMPLTPTQSSNNMSSDSQLVEDILKEMGESPGTEQQSNINSQALHYAMDSAQVPQHKYVPPKNNQQDNDYNNYEKKMMMDTQNQNSFLGNIGFNLNGDTIKEKVMNNIKYPLLVFIICFLLSLPEFNRFLFGFFPKLLLESGQVSISGVILKAFTGMLLYVCIVLFI